MHGLINRSIQCFVQDTYGQRSWEDVVRLAGLKFAAFDAMLTYDDVLTDQVIDATVKRLGRSRETVLEDLGHYLVSHDSLTSVRRLLRFSGLNFIDFINSLEELAERGRLVLPSLDLPELELMDHGGGRFILKCMSPVQGVGHVLAGLLRAMADDYGALVTLDNLGEEDGAEIVSILIADQSHFTARPFHLGTEVA